MLDFFIAGVVGIVSIFLFAFLCFIAGTIAYIVEDVTKPSNKAYGRTIKDSYECLRRVYTKEDICVYGFFVLFLVGTGFIFCAVAGMFIMSILGIA